MLHVRAMQFIGLLAVTLGACIFSSSLSAQDVDLYRLSSRVDRQLTDKWSASDSLNIVNLMTKAEMLIDYDPDSSISYAERALTLSREWGFRAGITHSFFILGIAYLNKGKYETSEALLMKAFPLSKEEFINGNRTPLILWNKNMGFLNSHKGEYEQAFRLYYNALAILQSYNIEDENLQGMLYSDIGSLWQHVNQREVSIYYLHPAEKLSLQAGNKKQLGRVYVNLGNVYAAKGDFQRSRTYFWKAIKLSSAAKDIYALQIAYISIAMRSLGQGQIDTATHYFEKAISTSDKTNPINSRIIPYMHLSKIYLDKGDHTRALILADSAFQLSKSLPSYTYIPYAQRAIALAYEARSDWRRAYINLKSSALLLDSLTSDHKIGAASQLEIKYRTAEKDRQLIQQKLQLTQKESRLREQNFWIWSISIGSLLSAIIFVSLYRIKSHKQRLQQERIRNLEKDQEISQLQAIMQGEEKERTRIAWQLHDGIVSQLLAVKLKFKAALPSEAEHHFNKDAFEQGFAYLETTTKDLRKTAHNLMPETVLNAGMVNALDDFCQKMDSNEMSVNFMVVGTVVRLDQTHELTLYRMVQELVQNAVKYAGANKVLVQLCFSDESLSITVEDNGRGLGEKSTVKVNGGLKNMRERLKLLHGTMEITSSPEEGLTIELEVPYSKVQQTNLLCQ